MSDALLDNAPHTRHTTPRADDTVGGVHWTDDRGTLNGPYMAFYPDGSLKIVGVHKNGARHGWWLTQSPDGTVIKLTEYDHGKEVGEWKAGAP